jgi:cyclopropane fatty-acyl-phospholipid synthase-like methyltransferase
MGDGDTVLTPSQVATLLARSYPKASGLSWLFVWLRPFICPFGELLAVMPKAVSYLDIGCGIGIMSVLLATVRQATRIVGIDTSESAVAAARQAILPAATQGSFRCVSKDEPWPQDQVDNVVCLDVLHHVPVDSQRDFVRRLARTNFTDAVYFKDVSPSPRWKAWGSHIHDFVVSQEFIHIRDEHEVRRWFEEEGLTVSGPHRMDRLWYTHYFLVARRNSRG